MRRFLDLFKKREQPLRKYLPKEMIADKKDVEHLEAAFELHSKRAREHTNPEAIEIELKTLIETTRISQVLTDEQKVSFLKGIFNSLNKSYIETPNLHNISRIIHEIDELKYINHETKVKIYKTLLISAEEAVPFTEPYFEFVVRILMPIANKISNIDIVTDIYALSWHAIQRFKEKKYNPQALIEKWHTTLYPIVNNLEGYNNIFTLIRNVIRRRLKPEEMASKLTRIQ